MDFRSIEVQRWMLAAILAVVVAAKFSEAQLTTDFYDSSCPQAASIVKQKVDAIVDADRGLAAALMRLHFHDCFVRVSELNPCTSPCKFSRHRSCLLSLCY